MSVIADFLISNGVTVQKWIPVTELPDVGVKVLTLDKGGHVRDRELYQFSDGLKLFRPDGMLPGKDITHWRPMLQGPRKDE